jgi:MFS transporter, DHA2 family, multidrug resistance protein
LVRQSQIHGANLISHVSPFNPAVPSYLSALGAQGLDVRSPSIMAAMAKEIGRQAQMLAFNDLFWFLGWFAVAMLPLLLVMKRPAKAGFAVA